MSLSAADPISELVAFAGDCRYEDLPAAPVAAAKHLLIDTLGNGVAGTASPESARVLAGAGGGVGDVPIWGRHSRLTGQAAALVNSYQIHCLEYDCVHEAAVLHPMTPLVAAVMANAQALDGVAGRDLIVALIVGVDISCRIALASTVASPFFRTGSVTALGVAAACARLRGLPREQIHHAIALAFQAMGSSRQAHTEGTSIMGLLAGFAARDGLLGCDLAEQGVQGPRDVLTGAYGYWPLYEGDYDHVPVWRNIGNTYLITELAQKPYPSGRPTHLAVDAAKALMAEHGITIAEVTRAVCTMPPTVTRLVGRPFVADATPNYAKLCTAYCVASTLKTGNLSQADFHADALRRPDVVALAHRVEVITDDNPDPNAIGPATLTLTLSNGDQVAKTIEFATGHPRNPMTEQQRHDKFWRCWELADATLAAEQGQALLAHIDRLETNDDIGALPLLTTPAT